MIGKVLWSGLAACHGLCLTALSQQPSIPIPGPPGQAQPDEKRGLIQGKVIAAGGGGPLSKAILSLQPLQGRRGDRPRTVRSDDRGEYQFKDLEAGKYRLRATRNGYVPQAYGQKKAPVFTRESGGTPLTLRPGEVLGSIDFELIRGGVVEGRVTDQDSEPLSRVSITLSGYRNFRGERSLLPVGWAQSDDRGRFRLFDIPPGSYFLSASFRSFFGQGAERTVFPPTYYPGVLSPQEAVKVEVAAGAEVGGFDITLIETLGYSVSGRVVTAEGKPAHSVWIMSSRESGEALVSMARSGANTDLQGEFKFSNLLSGKHRLVARTRGGEKLQMASVTVEVTNQDLEGLTMVLGEGAEITGRILADSEESDLDWRRISISMTPAGTGGGMRFGGGGAEVKEDLTFKVSNLLEGPYRFSVTLQPGNHYVESIRVEGQEIIDRPIQMRNNQRLAGVEVLVSSKGARITGLVQREEPREALKGATVLVFSPNPQLRGRHSRFTKTAQTDQEGRFSLEGLVPAEYLLCALVNHESGRESELPYLGSLEKGAERVDLSPGQAGQESLVAMPAPRID